MGGKELRNIQTPSGARRNPAPSRAGFPPSRVVGGMGATGAPPSARDPLVGIPWQTLYRRYRQPPERLPRSSVSVDEHGSVGQTNRYDG